MNHSYRLVWNEAAARYVPAPETAKGRGKSSGRSAVVVALGAALLGLGAHANPVGGSVTAGSGSIAQSGANTTITQSSQNLAINWASFGVAAGQSVNFVQPNSSAIALNRVTGSESSVLNGSLSANGQVWILNPNGVLFGNSASVNVGGLVASTLSLSDADFLAGKRSFSGDGTQGNVVNQGSLTAGYVALLGKQVSNTGTITTANGTAALAAGDKITLDFSGSQLLSVQIDEGTFNALAENKGLIRADNGTVILTASAKDALLGTVVNNEGIIEAKGIDSSGGTILLLGGFNGGTVKVGGTLDASSANHDGGFIETSGAHVQVADGAKISTLSDTGKTGTWLVDPTDFTISSGSGAQTTSGIGADTLSTNLFTTSVTLETDASTGTDSGDINVNAAVRWGVNTVLTLNAYNDININAAITATGTSAGLVLNYGNYASTGAVTSGTDYNVKAPVTLRGANATLAINGTSYTLIHSMAELDAIDSTGLSGSYALARDLNASGTTYTSALVGDSSNRFSGTFAGLGHTIRNLTINASGTDFVGLFAYTDNSSVIRDIGLVDGSVSGNNYVGGLVGENSGSISNAYATGSVSGGDYYVGGLVGLNNGSISNAYVTGSVLGSGYFVGGLVGYNYYGSISNAYATGSVSGSFDVGGLVGYDESGSISNVYATGSVSGTAYVGGLLGYNNGSISNAYATGSVSGTVVVGGLLGDNGGSISNSYWDSSSTGQSSAVGGGSGTTTNVSAVTSGSAYSHASYANFGTWSETASGSGVWLANDGSGNTWVLIEGSTRPFLYSEYSTSIRNAHQLQLMAVDTSASYTLTRNIDASETSGSNASGMWTTAGFTPVGNRNVAFTGTLDGQSLTVNDLSIVRSTDDVGLIGYANGATLKNIGLVGGSVSGNMYVGSLVGTLAGGSVAYANSTATVSGSGDNVGGLVGLSWIGSISNAHSSGSVTGGTNNVGGLVGTMYQGSISDAYSSSVVTGVGSVGGLAGQIVGSSISNASATGEVSGSGDFVGGLVGQGAGNISIGYDSISNAYATGSVSGRNYVGGLVGSINGGSISNAHASGSVSGSVYLGGLVGENYGSISNAYATGNVSGSDYEVGGLVGYNEGSISNAYATGSVAASYDVGGLVGWNESGSISNAYATGSVSGSSDYVGGLVGYSQGSISNAYATGSVSGSDYVGALVGYNDGGTVTASFWLNSISTTGFGDQSGAIDSYTRGLSASEATSASTYMDAGWDVATVGGSSSVWRIYEGYTAPLLRSFMTALTVTTDDVTKTYDGSTAISNGTLGYTLGYTLDGSIANDSLVLGTAAYNTSSKNVGSYSVGASGLFSSQQGYDLSFTDGTATITAATLTVSGATAANKTYDGTTVATVSGGSLGGVMSGDTVTLGQSGSFSDKNAATGKTVTIANSLSGTDAGNYVVAAGSTTADITPAALTVTANNDSRTASATAYSGGNGVVYSGFVASETSTVLGGSLAYGGTSQGAATAGSYNIAASGLSAANYALAYVDGTLVINAAAAPVTPVTPAAPVTPVTPAAPVTPVTPAAPVTPVTPAAPVTPVTPAAPVTPVTPAAPVTPVTPAAPVTPVTPAAPVTPVTPAAPVTPVAPVAPVTSAPPAPPVTSAPPVAPVITTTPSTAPVLARVQQRLQTTPPGSERPPSDSPQLNNQTAMHEVQGCGMRLASDQTCD